ncbi:MAG: U32 family peptidase [Elusimicrobiota bacterium]
MVLFSIPFNGDLGLVEDALSTGKVAEVYFAGPGRGDASSAHARKVVERGVLLKLLSLCRRSKVRTNLLCNSFTLAFERLPSVFRLIRSLPCVDAVTVADPFALPAFRKAFPKKELQASVIMALDSVEKVEAALRLGATSVCLATRLNRDAQALEAVKRLKRRFPGFKVKLLANHTCRAECVFSAWHYLSYALQDRVRFEQRQCFCPATTRKELADVPFIRPEDVASYARKGWADMFKLAYRNSDSDVLRRVYDAYFGGG